MKNIFSIILTLLSLNASAQTTPKQQIHTYIDSLTAPAMHGRGYVQKGKELAAAYIQRLFKEFGLVPVLGNEKYTQPYTFPVNAFPGKMELAINGRTLKPGEDYIIDAYSRSFVGHELPVVTIDMAQIKTVMATLKTVDTMHAYYLRNIDSFFKMSRMRPGDLVPILKAGVYLIAEQEKLTWTVEQQQMGATVFHIKASAMPRVVGTVDVAVDANQIMEDKNENIIAQVPGAVTDSFIVISAHYDHLGMMGKDTYFPGASDNASGTAMLLYLASWYAKHPQHYSILFISFSGEEAGLLGSKYYVAHPAVPLGALKFLLNIDIMGDATDGVTVVNATEYPKQFTMLNHVNDSLKYIPVVKSRGKAANSDHYNFSEKGVPSFFFYSNGGKGYYHDIFDVSKAVTLENVDGVAKLLIDFITLLN